MNDEPAPTPPSQPATSSRGLVLPANFVDVTAEQIGTVIGIIGAPGRKPRNSSCHLPASAIWHQLQARARLSLKEDAGDMSRPTAAPMIQNLVGGQIDIAISDPVAALAQVQAGTIKAYGITAETRLPSAPDIPTLDEVGLPGFDISQWHGLWLPKGTRKNIIGREP